MDKKQSHDEYQYDEEEISNNEYDDVPEGAPRVSPAEIFARLKDRRFVVPLVIVIAIFVVYKFLGSGSSSTEVEQKTAKQTTTTKQVQAQTTQTTAATTLQKSLQTISSDITALQQKDKQYTQQLSKLQDSVDQGAVTRNNLSASIATLQQNVQTLVISVVSLKAAQKKPKTTKKVMKKTPVYYLNAVIQDRAWLESESGRTLTVKVGDSLPGYGKIEMILPSRGLVATGSGKVIRYGKNDS